MVILKKYMKMNNILILRVKYLCDDNKIQK